MNETQLIHDKQALYIIFTVWVSMEAVASSIISTLEFLKNALARQNNCLCPTL